MRRCFGNEDIRVGVALHNMAGLYMSTESPDFAKADSCLREALNVSCCVKTWIHILILDVDSHNSAHLMDALLENSRCVQCACTHVEGPQCTFSCRKLWHLE